MEISTIRTFLSDNSAPAFKDLVDDAYTKSLIALAWKSHLTVLLMESSVFGLKLPDAILCALCLFVPIGSLSLLAVPFFSAPAAWSIKELGALFAIHAASTGAANFCWLKLATCTRIPRLIFISSLFQFSLLPLLYLSNDTSQKVRA